MILHLLVATIEHFRRVVRRERTVWQRGRPDTVEAFWKVHWLAVLVNIDPGQ